MQLYVKVASDGELTATNQRSGRMITEALPAEKMVQLRGLISQAAISEGGGKPSSCADCFIYDLVLESDSGTTHLHADDVTLGDSGAQALVAYLRSLRDSALASTP